MSVIIIIIIKSNVKITHTSLTLFIQTHSGGNNVLQVW